MHSSHLNEATCDVVTLFRWLLRVAFICPAVAFTGRRSGCGTARIRLPRIGVEYQTEAVGALVVAGDLSVNLFLIQPGFVDGHAPRLQASPDRHDLGPDVLLRINPGPLRRVPLDRQVVVAIPLIITGIELARQDRLLDKRALGRTAKLVVEIYSFTALIAFISFGA